MTTGRGEVDRGGRPQSPRITLNDLRRRLENVMQHGVVEEVDYSIGKARVRLSTQIDDANPGRVTQWIPWTTGSADSGKKTGTPLQKGAQVMVMSPSGDTSQGTIFPGMGKEGERSSANTGTQYLDEYSDGTTVGYDAGASTYIMSVPAGGSIKIECGASSITLTDGEIILKTPKFTGVQG